MDGLGGEMRLVWAVAGMVALCACGQREPAWKPSEAMASSARMLQQLDRLEAELHDNDAEVGTYTELVRRHGEAQQIACSVTNEHVQEIHRLEVAQEKKREEKRKQRRLARASVTRKRTLSAQN